MADLTPWQPRATIGPRRVDYVGPTRPSDMKPGDTWSGNVLCRAIFWDARNGVRGWPLRADVALADEPVCWIGPDGVIPPRDHLKGQDWLIGVELDRYARTVDQFAELLMPADGQVFPHEQPAAGGIVERSLKRGGVIL